MDDITRIRKLVIEHIDLGIDAVVANSIIINIVNIIMLLFSVKTYKRLMVSIFTSIISILTILGLYYKVNDKDLTDLITQFENTGIYNGDESEEYAEKLNLCKTREEMEVFIRNNKAPKDFCDLFQNYLQFKTNYNKRIFSYCTNETLSIWFGVSSERIAMLRHSAFEKQIKIDESIFNDIKRIINLIISFFFSFIISKIYGDEFKKIDGIHAIRNASTITSPLETIWNCIRKLVVDKSGENLIIEKVEEYTKIFDDFLALPNYAFSKNRKLVHTVSADVNSFEKFYRSVPNEFQKLIFPLQGLHTAVVKRRNEILSSVLPKFARQEPFVVLIHGEGGIGKTRFVQDLARELHHKLYPNEDFGTNYIEISPDDKYWPPLSGQRIAFFDEAGTVNDLRDDLLFRNLKSICSPAYFNCAAADIEHKISPCSFEIVFATTNTSLSTIQGNIASMYGNESVYPFWRRCMVFTAEWNTELSKYSLRDKNTFYANGEHINLYEMYYPDNKSFLEKGLKFDKFTLMDAIIDKFNDKIQEYNRVTALENLELQNYNTRNHLSICIYGEGGSGKSSSLKDITCGLQNSLQLPIGNKKKRSIIINDDLIKESNDINCKNYMDYYNNEYIDNSLIINLTNVIPTLSFIPIIFITHFVFPFVDPFLEKGMLRRMGYTEFFRNDTPKNNISYFVKNFKFYKRESKVIHFISWYFLLTFSVILITIPIFPVSVFLFYFFYRRTDLVEINNPSEEIYNAYNFFLKNSHDIVVEKKNPPHNIIYDYRFEIKNLRPISFSNPYELKDRIYLNANAYEKEIVSGDNWKMYVSESVARRLTLSYEKFFLRVNEFNYDTAISEITRFNKLFLSFGLKVNMELHLGFLGSFYLVDNVIYSPDDSFQDELLVSCFIDNDTIKFSDDYMSIEIKQLIDNNLDFSVYNVDFFHATILGKFLNTEFYFDDNVRKLVLSKFKNNLKVTCATKLAKYKHDFDNFMLSPLGKVLSLILKICSGILFIYSCYDLGSKIVKKFSNNECENQGRGERKIKPTKFYDSDGVHPQDEKQARGEKKIRKTKYRDSDGCVPQDILDLKHEVKRRKKIRLTKKENIQLLPDVNSFDSGKIYYGDAKIKLENNLVQLYVCHSESDVLPNIEIEHVSCYGFFIGGKKMITVGHVCDNLKTMPQHNLYVACDQFGLKMYKAKLLINYNKRDISLWEVDCPISFPSLEKLFVSRKELYSHENLNTVMVRFGANKKEINLFGNCEIIREKYKIDGNGCEEFGFIEWATHAITLTTNGDCGLPYYACERSKLHNKIFGIHIAGNKLGFKSVGISALVFSDDFKTWINYDKQNLDCRFCDKGIQVLPAKINAYGEHKNNIVWNSLHESSAHAFNEEITHYLELYPSFIGCIIKNSGILYGSIEHSHTKFVENYFEDLKTTKGWQNCMAADLDLDKIKNLQPQMNLVYRTLDVEYKALFTCFNFAKYLIDYRIRVNVYVKNGKRRATIYILTLPSSLSDCSFENQGTTPLVLGETKTYVQEEILDLFNQGILRKRNGAFSDIPYDKMENNETVTHVAVLNRNMTPKPNDIFQCTPYYSAMLRHGLEHKVPVNFSDKIPHDQIHLMSVDRRGLYNPRITQSLKWAHKEYIPNYDLRKYCKEQYITNIMLHYNNLNLLTHEQVLRGYDVNHRLREGLGGMEIDSSIGWTLKELFKVVKKNDVIELRENGEYHWLDNECSKFARQQYFVSCEQAKRGQRYYTAFNELLKQEKLKPSKNFLPRTFTANDLNGVLMERRILGEFSARATLFDENCCVGINPLTDFIKIYKYIFAYPNRFTGDYKNFDRTIPAFAFEDMRDMLSIVNPHIRNELFSCFDTIINRIQVSGNGIYVVRGGMPSGCVPTATLNSKLNDYLIYIAYVHIMQKLDKFNITNYACYNKLVRRVFYGDDLLISVDDSIKDHFNLSVLSPVMFELFGMTLTDSAKSGNIPSFDKDEDISFISRFFVKIGKNEVVSGALKKISIQSHLFYTTSNEPSHLGSLLNSVQEEAALWGRDYFCEIQNYIRQCLFIQPKIRPYFNFRTFEKICSDIEIDTFYHNVNLQEGNDSLNIVKKSSKVTGISKRLLNYFNTSKIIDQVFFGNYKLDLGKQQWIQKRSMAVKLNEYFQAGFIEKPFFEFAKVNLNSDWDCTLAFLTKRNGISIVGHGSGTTKAAARELAANAAIEEIPPEEFEFSRQLFGLTKDCEHCTRVIRTRDKLNNIQFERQMNISKAVEQVVPSAPVEQLDPSVAPDSGIATNTVTPSISRVLNPIARALDNPAASGAPFDKHTYCYNVFTRWTSKSTVVNKSLAAGAEVFRISLKPSELPKKLYQYVAFHKAIIPQLEVQILIGGAAGTVGWLKIGWVPDANKIFKYTLDDLQTVASETINLNSTITMSTIINDNRRSGLYRNSGFPEDDKEPWPGIVCLVEHPITNVQRNDDVNYPVIISVRLGPDCCLMKPYNDPVFPKEDLTLTQIQDLIRSRGLENSICQNSCCRNLTTSSSVRHSQV